MLAKGNGSASPLPPPGDAVLGMSGLQGRSPFGAGGDVTERWFGESY